MFEHFKLIKHINIIEIIIQKVIYVENAMTKIVLSYRSGKGGEEFAPSLVFSMPFFCKEDRELQLIDFLNLEIVDRQELILYEYMVCDGRVVSGQSRLGVAQKLG